MTLTKEKMDISQASITETPYYFILKFDDKKYYFVRDTGKFDGTSWDNHNEYMGE